MKSRILCPKEYEQIVNVIVKNKPRYSNIIPEKFIRMLQQNHAICNELDADGLSRKSPLIVALGDSVTAGYFEGNACLNADIMDRYFQNQVIEHVVDIENVYHEIFRRMLAEKYERTAISVINSGIAGDDVLGMNRRLEREVLRYCPDLVLVNTCINGSFECDEYERHFRRLIDRLQQGTTADIIIMTPNMVTREFSSGLEDRVKTVRWIADEKGLCIADAYAVWEQFEMNDIEIDKMLSNRLNHPTILGHEIYAMELMKLF